MPRLNFFAVLVFSAACDSSGMNPAQTDGGDILGSDGGGGNPDGGSSGSSPTLAGCPILPANHVFNTPVDSLPVDPNSATYISSIGVRNLHLDLGSTVNQQSSTYYGIPWNVVHANTMTWVKASYYSADANLNWMPRDESDCGNGAAHTLVSPCLANTAPSPVFPLPGTPQVEGGIDSNPLQPYGDHHILLLDADSCRLWELYHCYPDGSGGWDIFGSASFDLRSSALRPADWTAADAAGFPILPLLLKADEASSGTIKHALRFTIDSSHIRAAYQWPARHLTGNATSPKLPQMGQLFRLKASYQIPANYNTQARAILQAMKTYGMYIADGGSDWYVSGEPSANWQDLTISQVQSVSGGQFEAVDISAITGRAGFDANSGAVPAP